MTSKHKKPERFWLNTSIQALEWIERIGNRLPAPTALFFYLCLFVLLISALAANLGLSAHHPLTNEQIHTRSLLSLQGLDYVLTHLVTNFMSFAPLGPVLVAMLGIGLADKSGLLKVLIKTIVNRSPQQWISYSIVLGGILSNLAADAGYVVYIPLCAMVFHRMGRAPLAGIAAAFAGVSGGYSANLMIGPVDIILSGLTQEAAQLLDTKLTVSPTCNYYFLFASTGLITICGGYITDHLIEPYLRKFENKKSLAISKGADALYEPKDKSSQSVHLKALQWTFGCLVLYIGSILTMLVVFQLQAAFLSGLVVLISLGFGIAGVVFGKLSGQFEHSKDWVTALEETFKSLSGYLVLMFFASQFVSWFNWSQLGTVLAIQGAKGLAQADIPALMLILCTLLMSSVLNLFIGSASAKWALLSPILVPLLMLLDIHPAWTQIAYRIGDSTTNIITPLMPYFALVLAFAQQHDPELPIGRLLAVMLPYSIGFLVFWTTLLLIWHLMGWPLGF